MEAARLAEERKHTEAEQERLAMAEEEVAYLRTMLEESGRRSQTAAGWCAPADLQPWLQLCYEMELQYYNTKKSAAEMQLEQAREGVSARLQYQSRDPNSCKDPQIRLYMQSMQTCNFIKSHCTNYLNYNFANDAITVIKFPSQTSFLYLGFLCF